MRKFGYLASNSVLSERIYDDEVFVGAIKNMQKFGGLNQTGELDGDTLKVRLVGDLESLTHVELCAYASF